MSNLAVKTFEILRGHFFDNEGNPIKFSLREKSNTQDDPFDEYIASCLNQKMKDIGANCQKSPGPLISPDMVVTKTGLKVDNSSVINNPEEIIGIEVKKLKRGTNGGIARPTGLDYNSTPPCGKVRVYTSNEEPLIIKSFYLFACLEDNGTGEFFVSAMCLCDGSILNDDFNLYDQITGSREKDINMGTYGDGANRNRPMLIFSNPLGSTLLDKRMTLISGLDLNEENGNIKLVWRFIRKDTEGTDHVFYTYMSSHDISAEHKISEISEPFPKPKKRVNETQGRGKFKILLK